MLSHYEAQALQQSMEHELRGNPGTVTKCAAGLATVTLLCLFGTLGVGLHTEAMRVVACAGVLEYLVGMGF